MLFNKIFKNEQKSANARKARTTKRKSSSAQKTRRRQEQISVKDLRIGMFVTQLDKPWEESCFMLQGVDVTSTEDILTLQKECTHVWVDYDEMSLKNTGGEDNEKSNGLSVVPQPTVDVRDELSNATGMHTLATAAVSTLFDDIRLGAELDGTAQHSMNVSALSIIMGKAMGFSNRELEDVGVCGMLHDVGKTRLPSDLLEKTTKLTDAEVSEMQKHTHYGRDILMSSQNVMSGAADVAFTHHEWINGKGYPNGITHDSIPVYSKIVAIAEAYDNMTAIQSHRAALSPSAALQALYAKRGTQFDESFVVMFIDSVGIFPPGSIVEMVNKEVGIVLANTGDKLRPRVIMILDSMGEPAMQRVVDLSLLETDSEGNAYQIKTTHQEGSFGINVGDFQRAGLRIG